MKSEILLQAIGKIDDELIANAGEIRSKNRIKMWLSCGAVAACIALVVFAGSVAGWFSPIESSPELPMLTISEDSGGMGFEGYMAYDISELVNANPWSEDAKLSTLPVFKSKLYRDENMNMRGMDFEAMRAMLLDTAERLGMDTDNLVITDDTPSAEMQAATVEKFASMGEEVPDGYFDPTSLIVEQDGIRIEVVPAMNAIITFDPAKVFPNGLGFHYYSPYEDVEKTAEYIKEEYKELLKRARQQDCRAANGLAKASLNETLKYREFKAAGTEGILDCKIASIILPLLADHVLREANHYIRLLESGCEH